MKACTLAFTTVPGGSQTVTGVVDRNNDPFIGQVFIIHGNSDLNSLVTPYRMSMGMDNGGSFHRGDGIDEGFPFGIKDLTHGFSSLYSFIGEQENFFFGGAFNRWGVITAIRSGEFDIRYDLNTIPGDAYIVTVLGGDDLQIDVNNIASNSNPVVGFAPVAVIMRRGVGPAYGTATSGGGETWWGWAAKDSGQSVCYANVGNFTNGRYSNNSQADINGTISFNSNGFSTSYVPDSFSAALSIGGTGVTAAAGVLTQPAGVGTQEIVTGLFNRVVFLLSTGPTPAQDGVLLTDYAGWVYGVMDGTRQQSYWCGEAAPGPSAPFYGARYLSNTEILKFAVPNSSSTSFTAVAAAAGFSATNKSFSLDWTATDGVQRQIHWLALGDNNGPTPPPPPPPPEGCVVAFPLGGPTTVNFLLLEDGSKIRLEHGSGDILLEDSATGTGGCKISFPVN